MSSNLLPKKDQPIRHICLKCGTELVRGKESYKIRNCLQKHKNEDAKKFLANIVPKDHESAGKLLATIKGRERNRTDLLRKHDKIVNVIGKDTGKSNDSSDKNSLSSMKDIKPVTPIGHNQESIDVASSGKKQKSKGNTKEMCIQRSYIE